MSLKMICMYVCMYVCNWEFYVCIALIFLYRYRYMCIKKYRKKNKMYTIMQRQISLVIYIQMYIYKDMIILIQRHKDTHMHVNIYVIDYLHLYISSHHYLYDV